MNCITEIWKNYVLLEAENLSEIKDITARRVYEMGSDHVMLAATFKKLIEIKVAKEIKDIYKNSKAKK